MNNPEIILELEGISKKVAAIPRVNVFSVPKGYFNTLTTSILGTIQAESLVFPAKKPLNVGEVPEGYFEGLASQIMRKIRNQEELAKEEINTLSTVVSQVGNKNIFSIPEGYFDGLANQVMNRIFSQEESVKEETRIISPVVSEVGNKNIYSVPEGYFESLPEVITLRIPEPAKVISMKRNLSFFKYAVAAVITGFLGLSVFNFLNNKEITNNIQSEAVMAKASEIIKNKTFDIELQNVSDNEIEQFLTESGEDVKAALVASVIDENNLPASDEYLTDDKTLDEYLNKLNLNN